MVTIKEGEVFNCEKCGKGWKVQVMMDKETPFRCGNLMLAKTNPDWNGCGHLNQLQRATA